METLDAAPQIIADRYEVIALLGVGGMGRVYRVLDRALDEMVALKMLRREFVDAPAMIERFRSEVKLARKVTSPHVVRTFDLGRHAGEHFLTMELVDGHSLAQRIDEVRGALSIEETLRIARAACSGIAAAHAAGVLHRDLKPDNVLVGRDGRIAITDFGIARAATPGDPEQTGDRFVGTPAYMAPEQVDGRHPIAPPTDVYAFGAILYEMLTGRRPFGGADPIQVAAARLHVEPPDPRAHRPDTSPQLAALVVRCMARDPAARFADGAALATALEALRTPTSTTAPTPIAAVVPGPTARSIAVFPLRTASPELGDLADGLAEEIIDALTATRSLRVRPLASIRKAYRPEADPRDIGAALGVEVVVDGSLRKLGDVIRISARAIGVADGFQLSADRIDTRPDDLLAAGDAIAKAVARALTVDLASHASAPQRPIDPRATALYLEAKAKLRAGLVRSDSSATVAQLERALALAPDDPPILATIALAVAREAFFGSGDLPRARGFAERAVALAPTEGEAWHAFAVTSLYSGDGLAAGPAYARAVKYAPGSALAQAGLGALLLELGAMDDAMAHLGAAVALDPTATIPAWDLARAHVYRGDWTFAERLRDTGQHEHTYVDTAFGRFEMWRGRRYVARPLDRARLYPAAASHAELAFAFFEHGAFTVAQEAEFAGLTDVASPRLKATRAQFLVEFLLALGGTDNLARAWDALDVSVACGLQDRVWLENCPLLTTLRADATRFARTIAPVIARTEAILAAIVSVV